MKEYQRIQRTVKAVMFGGIDWDSIQDVLQGVSKTGISHVNINPTNPSMSTLTLRTPDGFKIVRFGFWVVVDGRSVFVMDGEQFHEDYAEVDYKD